MRIEESPEIRQFLRIARVSHDRFRFSMTHDEVELKFTAPPEVAGRLDRTKSLGQLGVGRARTRKLHSTYYDTPELHLLENGISLRVRRQGRATLQSVKTQAARDGMTRREDETPLTDTRPAPQLIQDDALRGSVLAAEKHGTLRPVFASDVQRTVRDLRSNDSRIKLAIDTATIECAPAASGGPAALADSFCEIELELKSGKPVDVLRLGRALLDRYPLALSPMTKAERGYVAVTGRADPRLPVKRDALELSADIDVGPAYLQILTDCADHAQANLAAALSDNAEGIHQMRVALRRLRSAIDTFHPVIDSAAMKALARRARDLAAELSPARDIDVFGDDILCPVEQSLSGDVSFDSMRSLLSDLRRDARRHVHEVLAGPRFSELILDLRIACAEQSWFEDGNDSVAGEPLVDRARSCLDRRYESVDKYGRRIDKLAPAARHEMRKRLKKLRYAAEFFAPLFAGRTTTRYRKELAQVQDAFGYLNDVEVAHEIIAALKDRAQLDESALGDLSLACGAIIGWHEGRLKSAWCRARRRWAKLAVRPAFWH